MSPRRHVVAIVGASRPPPQLAQAAETLGAALIDAGFRIATGGLGGIMEAASRGGRASAAWEEGRIVGVLPGLDPADANAYVDIAIPTGMSYARNTLLVSMADVVIAVGGGSGTLSEIALAWQLGKPLVALDLGEGWSARLAGERLDTRRTDQVHRAPDVQNAVSLARQLAGQTEGRPGWG